MDISENSALDSREVVVIPILNPDGLEYSQTRYTMWRRNRSHRTDAVGVDINRNFEVGWGVGSSDQEDSDTYRGPAANSEEETRALLALVAAEHFTVSVTFHSYSELILFPWGYQSADLPGRATFEQHAAAMKELDGYDFDSVVDVLYPAGGATDDTFFSKYGAWTWSFELGRQFVPPEEEIEPITRTHTARPCADTPARTFRACRANRRRAGHRAVRPARPAARAPPGRATRSRGPP